MEIVYQPKALYDLKYWKKSGQKQIQDEFLIFSNLYKKPLSKASASLNPLNIIGLVCGHAG